MNAPARHHTPRSDYPTRGGQAGLIAAAKGRPFMPWQQDAADVALEFDPDSGLYRYGVIVLTVQRQAGKTTLVGTLGDHRCMSGRGRRVWLTMDTGQKADSWMRDEHLPTLSAFGDPSKAGTPYTKSLRAGQLGPSWPSLGSTFRTFPPTRDSLHSKQSDLVVVSEAWAFTRDEGTALRQAARPTMATRPGAQFMVESTLGDDSSAWLDDYVELGIASLGDPHTRVCFIDYGIPEDADASDLQVIRDWHPAYGLTFHEPALLDAVADFAGDESGFARAYGNRATRTRESVIPTLVWQNAQAPRPDVPDRAGLGLDATPSGDRFALGAAWRGTWHGPDGTAYLDHAYLEVLAHGPTTRETPALIAAVARRRRVPVTVDRAAIGAVELVDGIAKAAPDVDVIFTNTPAYGSACGVVKRGVLAGEVHHFGQRHLTEAVAVTVARDLGDGAIGWGRKGSAGTIAEFVAVTLALRGFDTLPLPAAKPRARFATAR